MEIHSTKTNIIELHPDSILVCPICVVAENLTGLQHERTSSYEVSCKPCVNRATEEMGERLTFIVEYSRIHDSYAGHDMLDSPFVNDR